MKGISIKPAHWDYDLQLSMTFTEAKNLYKQLQLAHGGLQSLRDTEKFITYSAPIFDLMKEIINVYGRGVIEQ